jgi:hypothetical protein
MATRYVIVDPADELMTTEFSGVPGTSPGPVRGRCRTRRSSSDGVVDRVVIARCQGREVGPVGGRSELVVGDAGVDRLTGMQERFERDRAGRSAVAQSWSSAMPG